MYVYDPRSHTVTHTLWGVHTLLVYTIWYRQSVCQNCGFHNSPPRYERNHELIWFVRQFLRYGCIFVEAVSHIKRACDVTSQTTDQTTTDSEWYARSRRTSPVTCVGPRPTTRDFTDPTCKLNFTSGPGLSLPEYVFSYDNDYFGTTAPLVFHAVYPNTGCIP